MDFRSIPFIYQNKKPGSRCFCPHCLKKSASELKTRKKALGKKTEKTKIKNEYTHLGRKTKKLPQRMAENLFKYPDKEVKLDEISEITRA